MTKIIINGSSSSGNSYALICDDEILLIELGVGYKDIIKSINFNLQRVKGAIVSHSHKDHFKTSTYNKIRCFGFNTYSTQQVAESNKGVIPINPLKRYKIGGFVVMPLSVPHNVECYSYVIDLPNNNGRLLFITDASDFPYNIKNIDYLMIETNYCGEVMVDHQLRGEEINKNAFNHISLQQALEITERIESDRLKQVLCIHLSDGNSNEEIIRDAFLKEFNITPIIADTDLVVTLRYK